MRTLHHARRIKGSSPWKLLGYLLFKSAINGNANTLKGLGPSDPAKFSAGPTWERRRLLKLPDPLGRVCPYQKYKHWFSTWNFMQMKRTNRFTLHKQRLTYAAARPRYEAPPIFFCRGPFLPRQAESGFGIVLRNRTSQESSSRDLITASGYRTLWSSRRFSVYKVQINIPVHKSSKL